MGKSILTKSDHFSSEYCISIVKVGEIKPIKGKDKIGYTLVNGETIVVRKDKVKEGDILFYASNECQLNKDFLGINNLFESASYELNHNSSEIASFVLKNKELRSAIDKNERDIDEVLKAFRFLNNFRYELDSADSDSEIDIVLKRYDKFTYKLQKMTGGESKEHVDKYIEEKTNENEEYKKRIEKNAEFIKQHVGFFNKTGRVRAIKLGGIRSMGFLFSINELSAYNADVHDINLEDFVGEDFDTVNGELFVKAYVPFVPERSVRNRTRKRQKKVEKFDRIIQGEFFFHYDTEPFPKCIEQFHPEDKVVISSKLHGCVEKHTIVNTMEYGDKTIGEIVDNKINCHIKAYDTDTNEIVYVPIDNFYTIPNDGEWYEIELENGKKITITGNNPIWLPELGIYRRVDELNGDEKILFSDD